MFKVNNKDTKMKPVSLLLALNMFHTLSRSGVFIVNFEYIHALF